MWSPEHGFEDSKLVNPQHRPIVELSADGRTLEIDWENLFTTVKTKCEEGKIYFPTSLERDKWMFPIDGKNEKVVRLFADVEQAKWSNLMFLMQDCAVFMVHTPTLWCLMNPIKKAPLTVPSSDVICFYYIVVKVFSAMTIEKSLADAARIQRIADEEMKPLQYTFFENLLGCGAFQHYFTDKRDPRASELLCREFVQYTIRVIQVLERQILRLSVLGFREETTGLLGVCTAIPPKPLNDETEIPQVKEEIASETIVKIEKTEIVETEETEIEEKTASEIIVKTEENEIPQMKDEIKDEVASETVVKTDEARDLAALFWQGRLQLHDMNFSSEFHPDKAPVPTADGIKESTTSFHGVNLASCEALLWYVQSRYIFPEAYAVKEEEV
jgi:hypothetical protein